MKPRTTDSPAQSSRLVAATLWVYRRLLLLHPAAFRREYGSAITQVFRQACRDAYAKQGPRGVVQLWLPACADLLRGALAEYLALLFPTKGSPYMLHYRRSATILFTAYIAFVLAGMGFAKLSEDVMKSSLPSAHPLFAVTYDAIMVLSVISLLAILLGGVPIALAALRFALTQRRRDILARFAVPPIALLVIVAYPLIANALHLERTLATTFHTSLLLVGGGFIGLFVVGAAVSTVAVLQAIARSDIDAGLVRFALRPGALAAIAMGGMTVATLLWSLSLWQNAPTVFWGNDGVLATSTLLSTLVLIIVMLGATVIALRALFQGFAPDRTTPQLA